MIEDFMDGFEAAANLVMRHSFDSPEEMRDFLELMIRTVEEKKTAF